MAITGRTAGVFTYSRTINATNGTGLQFSNDDGSQTNFNNTVTLNGGDAGIDIVNGSSASYTFSSTTITNPSGTAFNVDSSGPASLGYTGSITKNSSGRLVSINAHSGGALTFSGGTLTQDVAAGTGIVVSNKTGGTVNFTSPIDLGATNRLTSDAVTLANNSGGTTTFADLDARTSNAQGFVKSGGGTVTVTTGTVDSTGSFAGAGIDVSGGTTNLTFSDVDVTNNGAGGGVSFSTSAGTKTLGALNVTTTTSGTGLFADTAGTLNVTGAANTISATGGVGVQIVGTTIGASDVTFQSVSADGAANGIVLASTGSTGAFEVTGVGTTDDSGGVIDHTSGDAVTANNVRGGLTLRNMLIGDGTATAGQAKDATNRIGGDGIDLVGVDDVVLTNLTIARTDDHGIDGTDVTNFAISDSEILNAGDDNGDSGISFEGVGNDNLDGTATVTNTVIDGAVEFGMRVQNSSGTLGLTVTGSQFSNTANTAGLMFGEDGLQIEVLGSAQTTALIHGNSTFSKLESDGVMATTSENGGAVLNITIDGNTFTGFDDGAPNMRSDNAIELNATGGTSSADSPDLRYTINANTINSSSNSAILVGANDFTDVDGRITGNMVNGSLYGYGIEATLAADDNSTARMLVTGNTLSNYNQPGAFFNANNSGDLDITFNDNMVTTQPTDATAFENVTFQVTSGSLCAEASGNTVAAGGANAFGPGVPADAMAMIRSGGTAQLEVGSANVADPASTVLTTNNPAAASVFTSGTITVVANGTCATPITTPQP